MDDGTRISPEVEQFLRAARAGDTTKVSALLETNQALVDSVEAGGFSGLHFAAFGGDLQMIDLLASKTKNLDVRNYDGNTPLLLAAKMAQHAAIKRLVEHGADVNYTGKGGATALHHAAAMGHCATIDFLLSLGAKFPSDVCEAGSVLHWGCHSGALDIVGKLLYDHHQSINAVDEHGGTPLFTALFMGKRSLVAFLLEHGANVNAAAKDGSTPLHIAVEHASTEEVKLLLSFGANTTAVDGEGNTPLQIAAAKGKPEAARELEKPALTAEKRAEDALRFKNHGNKVFQGGENVKAVKFYTLCIALESQNHVYFSNRSAAHFHLKDFELAYFDACRCIALSPNWAKGYLRRAATLSALNRLADAQEAAAKGLALDKSSAELTALSAEIASKLKAK